jgi:acyl carrier protein
MTNDDARKAIESALGDIAPEVDFAALQTAEPFREQAGIDSFDFLNFLTRLHELTGVDVPESDYQSLETVEDLIAYIAERAV